MLNFRQPQRLQTRPNNPTSFPCHGTFYRLDCVHYRT